jgi:hypothetical protein
MAERWDQAAVLRYIEEGIEESLALEYKAAGALDRAPEKKKEIAKDVSAMANSAGGTIIYGIGEYQEAERKHLPEKLDPVDRAQFSKEWLEQVIDQYIRPRIEGVIIHPVSIETGLSNAVYVVEIPQSTTAHQVTADYRYYKRHNFQAVPMEDYEIRDVMNRATTPNVQVEFGFADELGSTTCIYRLEVKVKNPGVQAVSHFKLRFEFLDIAMFCLDPDGTSFQSGLARFGNAVVRRLRDEFEEVDYIEVVYCSREVLFPEDEVDIGAEIQYTCTVRGDNHDDWFDSVTSSQETLSWTLYADDMPPKRGEVRLPELFR